APVAIGAQGHRVLDRVRSAFGEGRHVMHLKEWQIVPGAKRCILTTAFALALSVGKYPCLDSGVANKIHDLLGHHFRLALSRWDLQVPPFDACDHLGFDGGWVPF